MPRSRAGWLARAWVVLVAGVLGMLLFGSSVPFELGDTGKPGKLTITSCETVGEGKGRHTYCAGSFTSDDGTVVDEYHGDESVYPVGKVMRRQRESSLVLDPVGWGAAALTLSAVLGSLAAVGVGLQALSAVSRRHPTDRQRAQRPPIAAAAARGRTLYPLSPAMQRVEWAAWGLIAVSVAGAAVLLCVGLLA
ncbi:hypothetical protein ACFZB9_08760 [Kitasatospora sp. NPDC008050]|uniref:hypothetical protein n=1 Tax=Kitasatospora sp. NPDC008050 TaxID=3364021 RepID=UPI0036EDBC38